MERNSDNKNRGAGLPVYIGAFTVAALIFQSIAVLGSYDANMHVYKNDSPFGTVAGIVMAILAVILAVIAFVSAKGARPGADEISKMTKAETASSVMLGGFSLASSFLILFETMNAKGSTQIVSAITLALALLSVPTAAYYIFSALDIIYGSAKKLMGLCPTLWSSVCLMRIYFDVGTAINDPVRILFQVSFVFIMLALLFEEKMAVTGKGTTLFVVCAALSVLLGISAAASMIIVFFISSTKAIAPGEFLMAVCEIIACLYLLLRASSFVDANEQISEE